MCQGWRPPASRRHSPLRSRAIYLRHVENAGANRGTSLDGVLWLWTFTPRLGAMRRFEGAAALCAASVRQRIAIGRRAGATVLRLRDASTVPDCGGPLRFVAAILLSSDIHRILRHLGLPLDPVELAPAQARPELDRTRLT
jgi:hypothetical protein